MGIIKFDIAVGISTKHKIKIQLVNYNKNIEAQFTDFNLRN